MWIRNQDKTGLVEVNSIFASGNKVICKNWILGIYESEERALKVLDKMHDHLNDYKNGYREVFEMPKK